MIFFVKKITSFEFQLQMFHILVNIRSEQRVLDTNAGKQQS
jgi:hypothetical protein